MRFRILSVAAVAALVACTYSGSSDDMAAKKAGKTKSMTAGLSSGVDQAGFDTSVGPGVDFFQHVNGGWLANTEIPADKSNYGSFTVLADDAEVNLQAIIKDAAAAEARPGSEVQKIGDFFASFMDIETVNKLGVEPLAVELASIDAISDLPDVAAYMAHAGKLGINTGMIFWINQDAKNTTEYITYMHQGGLGLPDRDYYLEDNERFEKTRDAYVTYINGLFELAGISNGADAASTIMAIEKSLAENHWDRTKNRQRELTYNKMTVAELSEMMPNFAWPRFLDASEVPDMQATIVRQPDFFAAFDKVLADTSIEGWKTYLRFKLVDNYAPMLSEDFVNLNFDFYGKTVRGIQENRPRWKRGVQAVEGSLGEAIGRVYVQKHFRPDAKARMDELVENLREAFRIAIDELEWMGPETKKQAQAKLAKFTPKIGYPDDWKDYGALEVKADDLVGNTMRSAITEHRREIAKLGKPINRGEWFMTPQTVNAYYNPSMNEIVFPAAILQPPFFNVAADDAVNYGGIGAVIGHEFSHGFDDQGRKSDGDGTLRDWWTESDAEEFNRRANGLVAQYDQYDAIDENFVNGKLTLGENIGDLAGLTMAYKAYKLSLNGVEAPVIDGLTGDQRFFLGWAQVWRRKYRDEELIRRLTTDPHSPAKYRVNGIVANMPAFYDAFDIAADDPMYIPSEKLIKIW